MNKYAVLLFAIGFSISFYILFQAEHTFRSVSGNIVSLQLLEQSKAGVSDSPFRYRVVTPWLMAGVTNAGGYALVEMALITVLLVSVFAVSEQRRGNSTTWVLIAAMLLAFSHEWQIYSTSRIIEGILAAWALIMLKRDLEPRQFWANLFRVYQLEDKAEVTDFIQHHKYLMPLIDDIGRALPNYFQKSVYQMGISDNDLVITVVPNEDEITLDSYDLEAFDDEWWIDNVHRANGKIIIDLE